MRLLKRNEYGAITIESFSDGLAPPYAILSHTWGKDKDEVAFADIVDGRGKGKAGYRKIYFCDIQAQRDGLQYFWIDTCCINKDDKAELSQAIQSMFRWYQNARTCYVYLSDVRTKKRRFEETVNGPDWQAMFRSSRWFTRGWTLQELIAPCTGEEEAFRRLRREIEKLEDCVRDLRDSDPRIDKKRIEETKGGLLFGLYHWVLDNRTFQQWQYDPTSQLLWIKGDPGKGKTMLLCGIIDEIQKNIRHNMVAYFFCQATDSRINNAVAVLRGLLYMLVDQQPLLARHVQKQYEHAGKQLFEDANAWVTLRDIFRDVLHDPSLGRTCLVVDALDECIVDLPKLLDFVAKQTSASSHVKWIVSSRNWPEIEAQLERAGHKIKLSLELNADSIAIAVGAFIEKKVKILATEKQYTPELQLEVLQYLTSNANDTFLWVALVCQNLEKIPTRHVRKKLNEFPPDLNDLYERMVSQISGLEDAGTCLQVLALAAVSYRPITISELVTLAEEVQKNADDVEEIVAFCGSFLTLREGIIYFVHQSAKDFLLTKAASKIFPDGAEAVHCSIFLRSMDVISSTLHKNIYDLKAQGIANEDISIPAQDPLASVRYSCTYWADHLCDSNPDWSANNAEKPQLAATIEGFFRETYLYWIEALSLCQSVEQGIVAVTKVLQLVENDRSRVELASLINDAWRFILHHKSMIKEWPLQIYTSGILFSPRTSIIRNIFKSQAQGWDIQTHQEHSWSACMQTLEGHSNRIWDAYSGQCLWTFDLHLQQASSVAFSPDGTRLALASGHEVKIGDVYSGGCLQTFEGHSSWVPSVAFSPDGMRLASASADMTVKIWDTQSAHHLPELVRYRYRVRLVAFSPDGTRLISASDEVKIWDAYSGQCLQTLKGNSYKLDSVAFSPDGAYIVSNQGKFRLGASVVGTPSNIINLGHTHNVDRDIRLDKNWILIEGEKILWIPPEYRACTSAIRENKVAVGTWYGTVWICTIDGSVGTS
ncbi:hypothetical protein GGP41_003309 [Bipolaris sorokiniana]|uniref:NACHT domain-containing protein n=1 Tax=Cochliobolus sativus TaxID=45130 RepID=A0A8H5ZFS3_COCSA|nr:hypothetical protein GGP41_003309 [Bipolaris sorokiniana]